MEYLPKTIMRIDMDERRAHEWAETARQMGHKVRVQRRSVSAEGISIFVWVCVAEVRKGK